MKVSENCVSLFRVSSENARGVVRLVFCVLGSRVAATTVYGAHLSFCVCIYARVIAQCVGM